MIHKIPNPLKNWADTPKNEWPEHVKQIHDQTSQPFNKHEEPGPIYKYLCWLYNEELRCHHTEWKWEWAD